MVRDKLFVILKQKCIIMGLEKPSGKTIKTRTSRIINTSSNSSNPTNSKILTTKARITKTNTMARIRITNKINSSMHIIQ
jgi:hypothetical protein